MASSGGAKSRKGKFYKAGTTQAKVILTAKRQRIKATGRIRPTL